MKAKMDKNDSKANKDDEAMVTDTHPQNFDADLVKQIKASAKEIWLAGLGAFSQKQADKKAANGETSSLYQQLVKEGRDIERVTREQLDRNIQTVKTLASDGVDQVKEKATGSLQRLEAVFDERVSKALNRLGLTTSHDYAALQTRLEATEKRLADLEDLQQAKKPKAKTKSKSNPAA